VLRIDREIPEVEIKFLCPILQVFFRGIIQPLLDPVMHVLGEPLVEFQEVLGNDKPVVPHEMPVFGHIEFVPGIALMGGEDRIARRSDAGEVGLIRFLELGRSGFGFFLGTS